MDDPLLPEGVMQPTPPFSPSSTTTTTSSHALPSQSTEPQERVLPTPLSKPLKAGGAKEVQLLFYLERDLDKIRGRLSKRTASYDPENIPIPLDRPTTEATTTPKSSSAGYSSFSQMARDLSYIVDVLWRSATPSLQTPYLLSVTGLVHESMRKFEIASPRSMMKLLHKIDLAFASLIRGKDLQTGAAVPGTDDGRAISGTAKVRIKSLVMNVRNDVFKIIGVDHDEDDVASEAPEMVRETQDERLAGTQTQVEVGEQALDVEMSKAPAGQVTMSFAWEEEEDSDDDDTRGDAFQSSGRRLFSWKYQLCSVFKNTITELGDTLGDSSSLGRTIF